MNEDFDEQLVLDIVAQALSNNPDSTNPFSSVHLGLGESDILSEIYSTFSKYVPEYKVSELFQDLKSHILSRKISLTLNDLHTITHNCRKCNSSFKSELPKWNTTNPDIVIISESPNFNNESIDVLINACKQASIKSENICLTYVNRCPVNRSYTPQEVTNCSSFLHQEIQLLNPKIIVTLGSVPASIIFGAPIKIRDYRGSINWLGYWPVVTTYSPYYAIKSGQNSIDHFYSDFRQASSFLNKKVQNDY